ncbi:glycosyltransferase family 2 protein [Synechococcus sp. BSA11S]|nr:glycosyltransferase family 2 protein [Synechococcus sp. BSA11S]
MPRQERGATRPGRPAVLFLALLSISWLIPAGMLAAGLMGQLGAFLVLSLAVVIYDTLQALFILVLARQAWLQHRAIPEVAPEPPARAAPAIAVIIPAWNEAASLPATLASVLNQVPQPQQVIVCDDGSTDDTLVSLAQRFDLEGEGRLHRSRRHPSVWLLAKEHRGKGDSINQGVALSAAEVVLILDADTELLPGALAALGNSFAREPDLDAVSGTLLPRCPATPQGRLFAGFQRYEYARNHLWRLAWSQLGASLIISGACSAFRRTTLVEIGGFDPSSWAEDYEIMYRLQRHRRDQGEPCRVRVQPALAVRTEAPGRVGVFLRQRRRWAGGFLETLIRYRSMVGNRRYGRLGLLYLAHNTFSVANFLYPLAWFLAGLALLADPPAGFEALGLLALVSGLVGLLLTGLSTRLYRLGFGRGEVSVQGALIELILRPFFYLPLNALSHLWGYTSTMTRRRSW